MNALDQLNLASRELLFGTYEQALPSSTFASQLTSWARKQMIRTQ